MRLSGRIRLQRYEDWSRARKPACEAQRPKRLLSRDCRLEALACSRGSTYVRRPDERGEREGLACRGARRARYATIR